MECPPPARALEELRIRYRHDLPDHRAEEEDQVGSAGNLAFEEHVATLQMTAELPPANAQAPTPGLLGHSATVEFPVFPGGHSMPSQLNDLHGHHPRQQPRPAASLLPLPPALIAPLPPSPSSPPRSRHPAGGPQLRLPAAPRPLSFPATAVAVASAAPWGPATPLFTQQQGVDLENPKKRSLWAHNLWL